jgi:4-hydroxy-3-polyprenylbenzoate decarboxylase
VPSGVIEHAENDLNVPFVSGSARFDAMVIAPCSMATLGRIASGSSDSALLRAADVFLKERRKLILVPRETPWSLIHARNVVALLEAGAILLPAIPSFYSRPQSVEDVVDTVVWRILDQIGLPNPRAFRWKDETASRLEP